MFKYHYKTVTKENRLQEGIIRAFSQGNAKTSLAKDGSMVIFLNRAPLSLSNLEIPLPSFGFSKYERIIFFRNLATMVSAGLTLSSSLNVFEEEMKNGSIKNALKAIIADIENGKRLSQAMKKFPRHFSEFLVESVNVGEITGGLSDSLERISTDLERDYELSKKIRSAMAYPIVIITVMVLVTVGLFVYVLPKITELFTELNAQLPLPTRIVLAVGGIFEKHLLLIGIGTAILIALAILSQRVKKIKHITHILILKIPIFGELLKEFNLARFFRALESLTSSGISLVKSVETAGKTLKNAAYRDAIMRVHPVLLHGGKLTSALRPFPFLFPLQTQRIIDVGEKTGKYEEVFKRIGNHYEKAVQHKTQMMTALLEPFLMIAIGIIVGGLALSIFLPIYQVSTSF